MVRSQRLQPCRKITGHPRFFQALISVWYTPSLETNCDTVNSPLDRLQRHLRLELCRIPLPFPRHRVRPSSSANQAYPTVRETGTTSPVAPCAPSGRRPGSTGRQRLSRREPVGKSKHAARRLSYRDKARCRIVHAMQLTASSCPHSPCGTNPDTTGQLST
jgi:hypothetical protein